jgi:ElaB/YqjD/DUF883 family membrane-anchored ribosome-binding protein
MRGQLSFRVGPRRAIFLSRHGTKSRIDVDAQQQQEGIMNRENIEGGMHGKSGEVEKVGAGNAGRHDQAMDHGQAAPASAKDAVSSGMKAGDNEIGALKDRFAQLKQSVTQLVQSQASTARGQVIDAVGAATDSVSHLAASAQETVASIETDVGARIKRNPWSAVAIWDL